MKKRWKRILRPAGLVLAAVLILVLGFASYLYFHKPTLKSYIEKTLSKRAGTTVTIGRLDYRLFPLRVEASGHFDRVLADKKPYLDEIAISKNS